MVAAIGLLVGGSGALTIGGLALTTAAGALTVAGTLVNLAGGLILTQISNNLGRSSSVQTAPPSPSNIQLTTRQLIGPRIKHYGQVRVGGQAVFFRAQNGKFYRVVIHGHGEVDHVLSYYLDKNLITLNGPGFALNGQYDVNGRKRIQVLGRSGAEQSSYYSEIGAIWPDITTDHMLNGLWTSLLIAEQVPSEQFRDVYPHNEPALELVAKTTRVLDPRTGQIGYSENAALVISDLIQSPDGFNLPGKVNLSQLEIAADHSDELVELNAGGFEPRYRLSGSYGLTEAPAAPLERMLNACGGDIRLRPDGTIGIHVGAWEAPTVTLDTSDVLELEYTTGPDKLDRYTELPFTYVDRSIDYSEVTGDPWHDTDLEVEYGGSAIGPIQDLTFAPSHGQARRCAKLKSAKDNPATEIILRCKPKSLRGFYERFIQVSIPEAGIDAIFSVQGKTLDTATLTVTYSLRQISPLAFVWNKSEEGQAQAGSISLPSLGIPAPQEFAAAGWGVEGAPGIYSIGVAVAWEVPPSDALSPVLEYSEAGLNAWQAITVGVGQSAAHIPGLTDSAGYDVRLAFETSDGARGDSILLSGVAAGSYHADPSAPTGLSVADQTGGEAEISFTASGDPAIWQTEIYRDGSLISSILSSPSQAITITDISGSGTFAWTARSVNVAGKLSATDAGPVNQTIT